MYGDYEDYNELMDDYNDQLNDLADQERDARDTMEQEQEINARLIAARKKEQAAYDDFIASLDMAD